MTILRADPPAIAAPATDLRTQDSRPATLPPAPTGDTHTIKPGETFSSIAAGIYGDEKKWTAIAQANPLVDPAKLKVGQVIRVPDLKQFEAQRAQQFDELRQAVTKGDSNTIMVQPGDTLSHIATKAYGKATLWPMIYKANRDVLETPDDVKPGMKLRIPPKP